MDMQFEFWRFKNFLQGLYNLLKAFNIPNMHTLNEKLHVMDILPQFFKYLKCLENV